MQNKLIDIAFKKLSNIRHIFTHKWSLYPERYVYETNNRRGSTLLDIRECEICGKRQSGVMAFESNFMIWSDLKVKRGDILKFKRI